MSQLKCLFRSSVLFCIPSQPSAAPSSVRFFTGCGARERRGGGAHVTRWIAGGGGGAWRSYLGREAETGRQAEKGLSLYRSEGGETQYSLRTATTIILLLNCTLLTCIDDGRRGPRAGQEGPFHPQDIY